jgi:hypothetical protein
MGIIKIIQFGKIKEFKQNWITIKANKYQNKNLKILTCLQQKIKQKMKKIINNFR